MSDADRPERERPNPENAGAVPNGRSLGVLQHFSDAFTADANEAALFFAIEAEQDGGDGDDISH